MPCRRVKTNGLTDVLVKPLENSEIALCLFNKAPKEMTVTASLRSIANQTFAGLPTATQYVCRDLWDKNEITTNDLLTPAVPAHGVKVYRVRAL